MQYLQNNQLISVDVKPGELVISFLTFRTVI